MKLVELHTNWSDIYINNKKIVKNPQALYFIEEIYNSISKNSNFRAIHAELKSLIV